MIIVAQRYEKTLETIKQAIEKRNPKRAREIFFTTNARELLAKGEAKNDPLLVVSSEIFNSMHFGEDIAEKIKKINPGALFFIHSVTPVESKYIDGMIIKSNLGSSEGFLKNIINFLAVYREGMTKEGIRAIFPDIIVY